MEATPTYRYKGWVGAWSARSLEWSVPVNDYRTMSNLWMLASHQQERGGYGPDERIQVEPVDAPAQLSLEVAS